MTFDPEFDGTRRYSNYALMRLAQTVDHEALRIAYAAMERFGRAECGADRVDALIAPANEIRPL